MTEIKLNDQQIDVIKGVKSRHFIKNRSCDCCYILDKLATELSSDEPKKKKKWQMLIHKGEEWVDSVSPFECGYKELKGHFNNKFRIFEKDGMIDVFREVEE